MTLLLGRHQVVCSSQMLSEFAEVMSREKFSQVSRSQVDSFLSIILRRAALVNVKQTRRVIAEDPEDDMVLSTALEGNASCIVSGDRHLLGLKRFRGVRIVTVEEMLLITQPLLTARNVSDAALEKLGSRIFSRVGVARLVAEGREVKRFYRDTRPVGRARPILGFRCRPRPFISNGLMRLSGNL